MRKAELLVITALFLFLSACGGGESTPGISGGTSGGNTGGGAGGGTTGGYTGPTGTVTVNIADPPTRMPLKAGAPPLPVWDNVRIIVQREVDDGEGNLTLTRFALVDLGNPPTPQTFTVPAADGYVVVVLFSDVTGVVHSMLAYGKSDPFSVLPGVNSSISVLTKPIFAYLEIIPPISVSNNQQYNVGVLASGPVNQDAYNLKYALGGATDGATPFGNTYTIVAGDLHSGGSVSFTAPNQGSTPSSYNIGTVYENTYNLHFQGQFFANSSVLDIGEVYTNWTFTCPNYTYNDPVLTYLVPDGGIIVGITYP